MVLVLYKKLKIKIDYEIRQIDMEFEKIDSLLYKCQNSEPDYIELTAIGAVLHSFYTGIESMFIMIEKHQGNELSTDKYWHKTLLENATQKKGKREPIISTELKGTLFEYLQFRHVFRHSYSFQIEWVKIKPLVNNLEKNWNMVKSEIRNFITKGLSDE